MNRSICFGIVVMVLMTWSECAGQSIDKKAVFVERDPGLNKIICGPRCVKHVLKYYGHDAELSELVHELQWPTFQKGATMAALAKSLERRGIHVRAVVVPKTIPVKWAYPVILHFAGEPIGHFTVLTSSKGGVTLWINERRDESFSSDVCFKDRTETVILTSDHEITDDDLTWIVPGRSASELWLVGLSFFPLLLLLIQWRKIGRLLMARKIGTSAPAIDSSGESGNVLFTRKDSVIMRSRCLSLAVFAFVGLWLLCSAYFVVLSLAHGMSVGYAVSLDDLSLQVVGGGEDPPCYQECSIGYCRTTDAISCRAEYCSYDAQNYPYCDAWGYTGTADTFRPLLLGGYATGFKDFEEYTVYCVWEVTCYGTCVPNHNDVYVCPGGWFITDYLFGQPDFELIDNTCKKRIGE